MAKIWLDKMQAKESRKFLITEYVKKNIIMVDLRKANSHSVDICRSMKTNDVRKDQETYPASL